MEKLFHVADHLCGGLGGYLFSAAYPAVWDCLCQRSEAARACPISCPYYEGKVQDYPNLRLPNAERASTHTGAIIVHSYLLGDESDIAIFSTFSPRFATTSMRCSIPNENTKSPIGNSASLPDDS